jgi:hypothetical protein
LAARLTFNVTPSELSTSCPAIGTNRGRTSALRIAENQGQYQYWPGGIMAWNLPRV